MLVASRFRRLRNSDIVNGRNILIFGWSFTMASSVLETFRRYCEDLTSLKQAGATALAEQAKCREKRRRRKILWDHRVRLSAQHMKDTAIRALQLIEDDQVVFKSEIANITAKRQRTTHDTDDKTLTKEVWKVYYDRLKSIQVQLLTTTHMRRASKSYEHGSRLQSYSM